MSAAVKRLYSNQADFSALARDVTIPIVSTDSKSLIDIELTFYAGPSVDEGHMFIGGQDYRLYVNDQDVTAALKDELKAVVSRLAPNVVAQQYVRGAGAYLRYMRSLGLRSAEDISKDEQFANAFATRTEWLTPFDTLGDRTVGWSGNLHPLCFLYRFIEVDPVSLSAVWTRHAAASGGLPKLLRDLPPKYLTFAQGPSSLVGTFDPAVVLPAGRLVFSLEFSYENPIAPLLSEMNSRLRVLSRQLETIRVSYLEATTAAVAQIGTDVESNAKATSETLIRIEKAVEQLG